MAELKLVIDLGDLPDRIARIEGLLAVLVSQGVKMNASVDNLTKEAGESKAMIESLAGAVQTLLTANTTVSQQLADVKAQLEAQQLDTAAVDSASKTLDDAQAEGQAALDKIPTT